MPRGIPLRALRGLFGRRKRCYNPNGVEFRILGALEVVEDGRVVDVSQHKARALLAFLILHANEAVSADVLVNAVWGEDAPRTVTASLQNYVSRLRKALGPDMLVSRPAGYVLQADPEEIDLRRAERLVAEARAAEPAERADKLRAAVSLWRGPALADLAYEPFAQTELPRLEELRLTTLEDRIDADLALGKGRELVGELETLVAEHPLRERLRAQLMLALYRAGRQADALAAYHAARATLVEELGIEPSPALRELEHAILRQDEALGADRAVPAPPARRAPAGGPASWRRRTVTVLFAELTTEADPEAVHDARAGLLVELRTSVTRHGGVVHELADDDALAVFGVPAAHEDDALRAVRTAVELHAAYEDLRAAGAPLELRIGLNTGEVLVGATTEDDAHVSGEPVGIAKRLAVLAEAGDILLAPSTVALVRDAVTTERSYAGPLGVRGVREPTSTFRLLGLRDGAEGVARKLDTPLAGRARELGALQGALEQVRAARRARLVVLVGDPGIGKTRLARELASGAAEEATVLTARCPSYGSGGTYLPLAQLVAHAAGEQSEEAIASLLADDADGPRVARRVSELIGVAEGAAAAGETFWAVRRFFEALARERPLLLVLEDLHWAEPTFLDLVDYLAEWLADVPVLLLATARPELLEARPTLAPSALLLEPLDELDAHALLDNLGASVLPDVRARIVATAEGNPLFVEQLLAFAAEGGHESELPPTLEALLASRLDRLHRFERAVLERAAVSGREFWRGAVLALTPPEEAAAVGRHLMALVRHGWIRAARSTLAEEDAFRFAHALVRDAAYAEIPKVTRAELHERLADWLDERAAGLDELVGSHLEEAFRLRTELGSSGRTARHLAADAGVRLGRAGIRAFKRGDVAATINLLERATSLLPGEDAYRRELLCELGLALRTAGELARAEQVLAEAEAASRAAHDRRIELRAAIELANVRLFSDPKTNVPVLRQRATDAQPLFEALGDHRSLARALSVLSSVESFSSHFEAWERAAERAAEHLRTAGWSPAAAKGDVAACLYFGPRPVDEAIDHCERLLADDDSRPVVANVLAWRGTLEAMRGRFADGRRLVSRSRAVFDELGQRVRAELICAFTGAIVETLAADNAAAERQLRGSAEFCRERHEWAHLATHAAALADVIYAQGRYAEAEEWIVIAEQHAADDDVHAQYWWRPVRAKLCARSGAFEQAEEIARGAFALVSQTDALNDRARVAADLAEVLRLAGRMSEATSLAGEAMALYEAKRNVVAAERVRRLALDPMPA